MESPAHVELETCGVWEESTLSSGSYKAAGRQGWSRRMATGQQWELSADQSAAIAAGPDWPKYLDPKLERWSCVWRHKPVALDNLRLHTEPDARLGVVV